MIAAPIVLYPKTNWTAGGDTEYYSDSLIQMISGYVPIVSSDIINNTLLLVRQRYRILKNGTYTSWSAYSDLGMTTGTASLNSNSVAWSLNTKGVISCIVDDTIELKFETVRVSSYHGEIGPVLETSTESDLIVHIIPEKQIQESAEPLTGVQIKRFIDSIKIMVPASGIALNSDTDFAGCNFYLSLTAGGGDAGYVKMNSVLVTEVDSSETVDVVVAESSYEDTANNLTVNTTKTRQDTNTYYTYTMNAAVLTALIREGKIPNIFLSDGRTISRDITYYFIVTATVFNKTFNESSETPYSLELEGKFLEYSTEYQSLPRRTRSDILLSMSQDIMNNNELVSVVPGSVLRDILDPLSLQFEKFYVIQDFIFATLSVNTLLDYDDSDHDGISDPISQNSRKQALMVSLGIKDPVSLQLLIDEQFDKWASNYNLKRKDSTKATGTVIFYTTIAPTVDVLIGDGTTVSSQGNPDMGVPSVSFEVRGSRVMDSNNLTQYYNPSLKRYEIEMNIEAQIPGAMGNVPAGTITVMRTAAPTFQVTNNAPTRYGTDRETNKDLTNRIKLAKISYDSGTEGGYEDTAYGVPGILQVKVEKAGDSLMMRDYDILTGQHIGGKVDVYIKGSRVTQLTDQVAFKYEYPTDSYGNKVGEQFVVTNAVEYTLRSINSKVTSDSPIVSVSRVRNITRNKDYNLTGLQIINSGNTIVLEKNYQNLAVGMATMDVIEVAYLYRSSNSIVLSKQPVIAILSVKASDGTIIDSSKYALVKLEDPLQNGRSSIAKDAVKFLFNENDDIAEFVTVTNEEHDMLLNTPARLLLKGVDESTIVVIPEDSETPYIKNTDYSVTSGDEAMYTYLNLLQNSKIRHGDRVRVSYNASENFSVTYTMNDLVNQVQDKIDIMKHACADAIVKEAVGNFLDVSLRVVRKTGVETSLLKSRIQTAVANYVSHLKLGEGLTQGALVSVVQNVNGVKEVKLPLTKMMKRNGSFIPMDDLGKLNFEVYQKTGSAGVSSYRTIDSVLTYRTSDNGGDSNLFRGIYENNRLLTLVDSPSDVSKGPGRGYIQSDGKLIVSTTDGNPPQTKYYKASYYTYYPADANIVEDIEVSEMEYIDFDSLSMKDIEVLDDRTSRRI